jgi:diadenosine tetraphosphate (Ap4A) HIT family hydrolase
MRARDSAEEIGRRQKGEDIAAVSRSVSKVSRAVNQAKSTDGLNLVQANGPGAQQSVAHFHVHVLPRKQGGVADRLRFPRFPKLGRRRNARLRPHPHRGTATNLILMK